MKLLVLSDLHVEFGDFVPDEDLDFDVVVLAGDIHVNGRAGDWARKTFKDKPVVLVLGNHDYYGSDLTKALRHSLRDTEGSHVHVLHNSSVHIDGVRFVGATLWTDYKVTGNQPLAMLDAQGVMSDHRKIRTATYAKVKPWHLEQEHQRTREYLMQTLREPFDGRTVVVTHHAPTMLSVHERYRQQVNSHLNAAYASSLEHLMGPGLDMWVHGHVHNSVDERVDVTRVLCNPRGYVGEDLNDDFNPRLVVEI